VSTVAATVDTVRVRPRTLALTDARALALLGGLSALLVALTWGTWGDVARDTGYDLVAGARVAHGEIPYVDFTYYYGPLAPALLGLASWLGGGGIAPMLAVGLAVAAAIVLATYLLGRVLTGPLGALLAAAIVAAVAFGPGNFSFVLPHTFSATLGLLAVLAFLLGLARHAAHGRRRNLLLAGVAVGLAALTRPEYTTAVGAAATLWLFLRARRGLLGRRDLLAFASPAMLLPAGVYGALATAVPPHRLLFDNLYPREQLHAAGNAVIRVQAPLTASSFAHLGGRALLYAAGAAVLALVAVAVSRRGPLGNAARATAVLMGTAIVAAAFVRPEAVRHALQFVYGWIPAGAGVWALVALRSARRERRGWTAGAQLELTAAVVLALVAAKTYGAFFLHATKPQPAVYAAPLAALLLVRLHLGRLGRTRSAYVLGALWLAFLAAAGTGLTLKDARAESAVVRGSGGALGERPEAAAVYRQALAWIDTRTRPGEPILLAPQLTSLYTLSGRIDPIREISLLPGALAGPADERAAIARLAAVRLAVIERRVFSEYGHTTFGASFDRVLAGWIRRHFRHAATLGGGPAAPTLDIWIRRIS
jgi:4-amino-4-deoxy-L-arabinose transferase-like glycosyltransferase